MPGDCSKRIVAREDCSKSFCTHAPYSSCPGIVARDSQFGWLCILGSGKPYRFEPMRRVGQNYIYGVFGGEITRYTVEYGENMRFWPALPVRACCRIHNRLCRNHSSGTQCMPESGRTVWLTIPPRKRFWFDLITLHDIPTVLMIMSQPSS